ncbi:23S rRNA pseudouridine(1911/1915/1917) synthase RluD [Candidatus Steffania adelgidicola]|uniref:Pseudouridine synthase n=1 Tax=Candidatus Steffania adelgidicola str. Klausen-Leopoldsdorf TaxID=994478 RepID=G3ADR0_9GAMM|nr:23S rRNA pseudouridine(1911/1915/1917) synthase RluD [Candidatus Steffania adelgidicola]CCB84920.1 pseudouridine synthase [Candidatus Steffania adelgidicola str. Klausen-Leopoldsdorf]
MEKYQHFTGTVNTLRVRQRLDQVLVQLLHDCSRTQIKAWILDGLVKVNGRIITLPKEKIFGGETVEVCVIVKKVLRWEPQAIRLNIIYEDDHILVINKASDFVVHPGAGHENGTVLNALLDYFPPIAEVPRVGIVHRLDKDTTGLMVVAKTVLAQNRLSRSLQAREITREYEAVAIGHMISGGTVDKPIARHPIQRTHMMIHPTGKPSVTHYRVMEHFRAHTRLRLRLQSGRTHQIRVHMAHINHPLVGDPIYKKRPRLIKGASASFNEALYHFNRQALHATLLKLCHPITTINMEWRVPLPQDMVALIAALKADTEMLKIHMNCL